MLNEGVSTDTTSHLCKISLDYTFNEKSLNKLKTLLGEP